MSKEKSIFISLISVISCFAVVYLHTNSCFWTFSSKGYWISANIIECVMYFAVPCFYMITGATLMNYRERYDLKRYFAKRINKTVIPFIFWSLVGVIYCLIVTKAVKPADLSVLTVYNGIMNSSYVGVYWFFLGLFSIYLSVPLFAAVEKSARKETFTYIAVSGFAVNSLIPFIINLIGKNIAWPLSVQVVSGALLYIPIGYLLCEYEMTKKMRVIIYFLALAGLFIHILGTYCLSIKRGEIADTFKGYQNVPCVLYSVGIFVLIKYGAPKILRFNAIKKAVVFLSEYTFAIYLMHWFIIDLLRRLIKTDTTLLSYRLLSPFLIIAIAVFAAFIVKKIPIIKRILP